MTNRQIDNRARKIKEIEEEIKKLEEQVDILKSEIKMDMESNNVEEISTGNFIIKWKSVISNKFDMTSLKKSMPDIYSTFLKQNECKRFTIA